MLNQKKGFQRHTDKYNTLFINNKGFARISAKPLLLFLMSFIHKAKIYFFNNKNSLILERCKKIPHTAILSVATIKSAEA
jgi:hypothetical protein